MYLAETSGGNFNRSRALGHIPNVFVLGAPKAGTTALHRDLSFHPDIAMSAIKEPNFYLLDGQPLRFRGPRDELLNKQAVTTRDEYLALFPRTANGSPAVTGESSPFYLYSEHALRGIQRDAPSAKFIVLLRDPVERAYSHFLYLKRDNREPAATFAEAIDAESDRIDAGWAPSYGYVRLGRYHTNIQRWASAFGRERLHLVSHEDYRRAREETLSAIYRFLCVSDDLQHIPSDDEMNASGIPRSRALHGLMTNDNPIRSTLTRVLPQRAKRLVGRAVRRTNLARPPLADADADRLRSELRPDAERLAAEVDWLPGAWPTTFLTAR